MLDIYFNWTPALAAVLFVLVYLVNERRFRRRSRFFCCGRRASRFHNG